MPLIARSHMRRRPWRFLGARVILLLRDPRDALVSFWHERARHEADWSGSLESFLLDGRVGAPYFASYVNGWAEARGVGPVLVTSYEQLMADTEGTAAAMLEHAGEEVDVAALGRACEAARFERMLQLEMSQTGVDYDVTHRDSRRMRVGTGPAGRAELSDVDTLELRRALKRDLRPPARRMMARLGLWPCA
jgi:hypothetical protein